MPAIPVSMRHRTKPLLGLAVLVVGVAGMIGLYPHFKAESDHRYLKRCVERELSLAADPARTADQIFDDLWECARHREVDVFLHEKRGIAVAKTSSHAWIRIWYVRPVNVLGYRRSREYKIEEREYF